MSLIGLGITRWMRLLILVAGKAALGSYSSGMVAEWSPSDEYDPVEATSSVPDHPNVWTNGSLVLDQVTGVSSSRAGFFAHQSENYWSDS